MVDDDVIGTRVAIHASCDKTFDDVLQQLLALAILLLVIFDAVLLTHGDKVTHHLISYHKTIVKVLQRLVLLGNRLAVLVHVLDGVLVDDTLGAQVAVIGAVFGGVDGDIYIGHHTAATIDRAAIQSRGVAQ